MTDNHLHFGQFENIYYNPIEVLEIVAASGIVGGIYSSTTTCSADIKHSDVRKEIELVLQYFSADVFKPYLWYIPAYWQCGLSVEKAFSELPYKGIKLHPLAHKWDFNTNEHNAAMHNLFEYAAQSDIPILIHSGPNGEDAPNKFERFFIEYPMVRCTLAHCRPIYAAIKMLQKYEHIYGDISFVPVQWMKKLLRANVCNKIHTGTDFPITHYREQRNGNIRSMQQQYLFDIGQMRLWLQLSESY